MTPLARVLAETIRRDGPISVERYMALCLFHPEHGYYRTRQPIGATGDFVTAPEISQIFGELIGIWAVAVWRQMGQPAGVRLVELGPGRGTLMADALRAIGTVAPDFRATLALHLVEVNPLLREHQAKALGGATPTWHDDFDELPSGPAIVIANEFFDALPVRQIIYTAEGWREHMVALDGETLCFSAGPAVAAPELRGRAITAGTIIELSPQREAYGARLAARVAGDGGAALIIDYGAPVSGTGDTLQAVRGQQKAGLLAEPGLADLTTHVDFAALARAATQHGAKCYGAIPQGVFLQRLGIAARAAMLLKRATPKQSLDIAASVRRLIDPAEMGTLFQALALAHPTLPVPPGFDA